MKRSDREEKKRILGIMADWFPAGVESSYREIFNAFPIETGFNGYRVCEALDRVEKLIPKENYWVRYKPYYETSLPDRIYFRYRKDLFYIVMLMGSNKIWPVDKSLEDNDDQI